MATEAEARRFVEIRSYQLKPGTGTEFDQLVREASVPMLREWGIDVVAFGRSLHAEDAYYLMRAYASLEDLEHSEAAFYGSDEWRSGPRQAILACIDTYISIAIEMHGVTVDVLREPETPHGAPSTNTSAVAPFLRRSAASPIDRRQAVIADGGWVVVPNPAGGRSCPDVSSERALSRQSSDV